MTYQHTEDREWEYPPVADEIYEAGIWEIKEYIHIWKATITVQVACNPIYELCTEVERMPGYSWMMRWWNQDVGREEE